MEVPGGSRIAQILDPQGGAFAVHEPAKQAAAASAPAKKAGRRTESPCEGSRLQGEGTGSARQEKGGRQGKEATRPREARRREERRNRPPRSLPPSAQQRVKPPARRSQRSGRRERNSVAHDSGPAASAAGLGCESLINGVPEVLAAHGFDEVRGRTLQPFRHVLPVHQPVRAVPRDRVLEELAAAVLIVSRVQPQQRDLPRRVAGMLQQFRRHAFTDAVENNPPAGRDMMA